MVYEYIDRAGEMSGGRREAKVASGISSTRPGPDPSSSDSSSESSPCTVMGRTGANRTLAATVLDGGGRAMKLSPAGAEDATVMLLGLVISLEIGAAGCRVFGLTGKGGKLELDTGCGTIANRGGMGGLLIAAEEATGETMGGEEVSIACCKS